MDGRPPPFGTLVAVVPVVQGQRRGALEMTIVSLERWDNCWAAHVELQDDPPALRTEWLSPLVELDALDDRGGRYRAGFGGGYSGGRRDGGQQSRFLVPFAPALDPAAGGVRLTGRLRLYRHEAGPAPGRAAAWEDPDPWVFHVSLAGMPVVPGAAPEPIATVGNDTARPEPPPELVHLRRVVPVVEEQADNGWAVTCVAAEVYVEGIQLDFRLLGRSGAEGVPDLGLRVTDDRGTEYRIWSGGGNGVADRDACHWRLSSVFGTAPRAAPGRLRVEIDEVRIMAGEPNPEHPGMHRLVAVEAIPVACAWDIDLDRRSTL